VRADLPWPRGAAPPRNGRRQTCSRRTAGFRSARCRFAPTLAAPLRSPRNSNASFREAASFPVCTSRKWSPARGERVSFVIGTPVRSRTDDRERVRDSSGQGLTACLLLLPRAPDRRSTVVSHTVSGLCKGGLWPSLLVTRTVRSGFPSTVTSTVSVSPLVPRTRWTSRAWYARRRRGFAPATMRSLSIRPAPSVGDAVPVRRDERHAAGQFPPISPPGAQELQVADQAVLGLLEHHHLVPVLPLHLVPPLWISNAEFGMRNAE